jgi:ANTAR domain
VPHTIGAGLTLISGDRPPRTLAASSELPARVDAIEFETGEGPCLEAIEDDDITRADDLTIDERWPKFSERTVRETPIRSMFGARIFLGGDDRGALNFYAPEPGAFTELDLGIGAVFCTLSSLALHNVLAHEKTMNLEVALESSRQIGIAMGILMSSRLITADQAFNELRQASQRLQRKVREIALEVTETGTLPEATPR